MRHVVFVVPRLDAASLRFVQGLCVVPGIQACLVSEDSYEKLPPTLGLDGEHFIRLRSCFDEEALSESIANLAHRYGPVVHLLGALEQLQVTLARVRAELGIEGMSVRSARNFRDKPRMKKVLQANDVPCARFALAHTAGEARELAGQIGFPMVVKPPAGAGGSRTFKLEDQAQLEVYLRKYPPEMRGASLMEEFIAGTEFSFDSVMIDGQLLWHSVSRYMPSPLEVLENPWMQWTVLLPLDIDKPPYDAIVEPGARALRALGLRTGLTHMEWFRRDDGSVKISEVGARPPGAQFTSLLSYAHEMDFYQAWPQLMIDRAFEPPQRRYAVGAAYVRGQGRGQVQRISGLGQAREELGHLVVEASLPSQRQSPSASYEGDGYIIVRDKSTEVVESVLKRIVSLIRVELG